jgi:hypothetical protein
LGCERSGEFKVAARFGVGDGQGPRRSGKAFVVAVSFEIDGLGLVTPHEDGGDIRPQGEMQSLLFKVKDAMVRIVVATQKTAQAAAGQGYFGEDVKMRIAARKIAVGTIGRASGQWRPPQFEAAVVEAVFDPQGLRV